jgi:hypothetical protein
VNGLGAQVVLRKLSKPRLVLFDANALNRLGEQSLISPTNVRARATPGVDS